MTIGNRFWVVALGITSALSLAVACLTLSLVWNHSPQKLSVGGFSIDELSTKELPPGFPIERLKANSTHGGPNLAVATARISDETDGIFFLDYLTGNLQCWVYYARMGKFMAKFETNVTQQLPPSKNAEYLLVTGSTEVVAAASNARPAASVIYVVDVKAGAFAAYTVPWVRAAETSGQQQGGPLVFLDYGQFRNPLAGGAAKKPPAPAAGKTAPAKGNEKEAAKGQAKDDK
jgi:hypothetical protein